MVKANNHSIVILIQINFVHSPRNRFKTNAWINQKEHTSNVNKLQGIFFPSFTEYAFYACGRNSLYKSCRNLLYLHGKCDVCSFFYLKIVKIYAGCVIGPCFIRFGMSKPTSIWVTIFVSESFGKKIGRQRKREINNRKVEYVQTRNVEKHQRREKKIDKSYKYNIFSCIHA